LHAVSKAAKVILILYVGLRTVPAQRPPGPPSVAPRTWDEQALANWATPLASLKIRPGHFSEDEYYRAPVDNYRTYAVYDPDREPLGYWESLRRKAPEPLIDIDRIGPSFDWVTAGKRVWAEVDVPFFRLFDKESISLARSGAYIRKNEKLLIVRPDGTLAHYRWVITPGGIGLSITACSSCHTRFLDDGTAISGAGFVGHRISDSLLDRMSGQLLRISYQGDGLPMSLYRQFGVPWLKGDIHETLKRCLMPR